MKRHIAKLVSTLSLIGMLSSLGVYQIALAAVQGQWPNSSSPSDIVISNNPPDETDQLVTKTSDGNYVVAMLFNGRTIATKVAESDGSYVPTWTGSIASSLLGPPLGLVPDNSGGVYIAQNIDNGGGDCSVAIQRLDTTGNFQFGFPGLEVTTGSGCEVFMDMIPDGAGGVYVVWGNGGPSLNTFQSTDLYATRVTNAGVVDANWNTGGSGTWRPLQLPETAASTSNEHSAQMVADGLGNVVVIYESSDSNFTLAITKFDANGTIAGFPWNVPFNLDPDNNGSLGRHLISDGSGNVYIGYLAGPFGSPDTVKVQKLDSSGFPPQWGTGVIVSNTDVSSYSGNPRIALDGSGGVLVAWQTAASDNEVYGHHVTAAGALDAADNWSTAPIALSNLDSNVSWFNTLDRKTMLSDGVGGAYVLYNSFEGGSWPISKLQHLNSDGSVEFAGDGTPLASGAGIDGILAVMTSDGGTGVVTVFQDEGPSGMDLYAQYFDETSGSSGGGGSENSDAEQEIICGALTLNVNADNDFQMTNLTVSANTQDSFGAFTGAGFATPYQNGTDTLPEEAFIYVDDSRTVGTGPGCATDDVDEGWIVGVEATNFIDSGAVAPDIPSSNLYLLATSNVTPDTSYGPGFTEFAGGGDGSTTNLFYTTGYSGTQNVEAPYNTADTTDLTTRTPFTTENASLDSPRVIMENVSGAGVNDFKFTAVGTGIAYYLNIPANQAGGSYTSTLTITLIPAS